MPFFTDLDSRAAVKGSRDPLGFVPLWSRFGRRVVGNLTTVSDSVRGFTTLLLGYYFAARVLEREGAASESMLDLFLKFEQLVGYARMHASGDGQFRGVDRVKKNLPDNGRVVLGSDLDHQILSNQKVYGLWGLYSMPARASGLLAKGETALTPAAREFVEDNYLPVFTRAGIRDGRQVMDLLAQRTPNVLLAGKHAPLGDVIATLMSSRYSTAERRYYNGALVLGGEQDDTSGRQAQLAALLGVTDGARPFDMDELRSAIKGARKRGTDWEELTQDLRAIETLESVLVPAAAAFGLILNRAGLTPAKVAAELRKHWGRSLNHVAPTDMQALRPRIAIGFHDEKLADSLLQITSCLESGDYEEFVRLLLAHNAMVMQARQGAAPWIRLENNKLVVLLRDEGRPLPAPDKLRRAWWNTYFINSLKVVQGEVTAA